MAAIVVLLSHAKAADGGVRIGMFGDKFTLNGTPTFLLGASYFDAYGWNLSDLDALQARKLNLIRIFLD